MLTLKQRIEAFESLGNAIRHYLEQPDSSESEWLKTAVSQAYLKNGWFTTSEVKHALSYWADQLQSANLEAWAADYKLEPDDLLNVGLILAGNIPMVGFHDVLSTIISGHHAQIKCSSSDDVLIPALLKGLVELQPDMQRTFTLQPIKLNGFDAVLATGSNNSARYFEAYFGKVPHVIRKNRTGIAVLNGNESSEDLNGLMEDVFRYYGLGCRNITKLYLPRGYDVHKIFAASVPFAYLMDNKKYVNNYTYHKALMIMERAPVLENEVLLMVERNTLFSPVSVLNYEFYEDEDKLNHEITGHLDDIQCVVGALNRPFGSAQKPALTDYADGANTLDFLSNLRLKKLPN